MIAAQGQQLWVQWQHLKFKPIVEFCVFASAHGSPTIVETTHSHGYRRCNIWVRVARTEKEWRTIDMSGGLVPIVTMVQLPGDLLEEEVTEEAEHEKFGGDAPWEAISEIRRPLTAEQLSGLKAAVTSMATHFVHSLYFFYSIIAQRIAGRQVIVELAHVGLVHLFTIF